MALAWIGEWIGLWNIYVLAGYGVTKTIILLSDGLNGADSHMDYPK